MSLDQSAYERVRVGEQLGHLEYVVTEESLGLFRDAVGYPEALYAGIAAKEHAEVLVQKWGYFPVISAGHEDKYYSHPRLNKRIQVTGWTRDKYHRRGRDWLLVETLAIDEDGREVVRSKRIFLAGGLPAGRGRAGQRDRQAKETDIATATRERLDSITKTVTQEAIDRFEAVSRAFRGRAGPDARMSGVHASGEAARARGFSGPVASGQMAVAYLHELLDRRFGVDFRQGGQLSARFLAPVYSGQTVTAAGLVTDQRTVEGRAAYRLEVWLENPSGARLAAGRASVTVPSPLA